MAVTKSLRYQVLRRDNHTCRYCGANAPDVTLRIDHVIPTALGGSDQPDNLVTACHDCNAGKSATPADASLIADVAQDALRWANAMKRVTDLAQIDRSARYAVAKSVLEYWDAVMSQYVHLPADWERSIAGFLASGLTENDMIEAVHIASTKYGLGNRDRWPYFCGICNRMIRQRQDAALTLVEAEESVTEDEVNWACENGHPRITPEIRVAVAQYIQLARVCDGDETRDIA